MTALKQLKEKILDQATAVRLISEWHKQGFRVVFTNGCFDILHLGHIDYLAKASSLGDKFIIGLNADASVSRLKGAHRPLQNEQSRGHILAALSFVDAVVAFSEDTPQKLIETLKPDIMVKGADYKVEDIAGARFVMANGGSVVLLPYLQGHSTTSIEKKIRES